jgi:hypothetical protein
MYNFEAKFFPKMSKKIKISDVLNTTVIVAALGYFVDVYDLVLFLIVGKKSLAEIGIASELVLPNFQYLLNVQMIGMLVGGLFWGILGDKKGRLSVVFVGKYCQWICDHTRPIRCFAFHRWIRIGRRIGCWNYVGFRNNA